MPGLRIIKLIRTRGFPMGLIIGLPLAGLIMAGKELSPYLYFPPKQVSVSHAPFSWPIFFAILSLILTTTLPLIRTGMAFKPATGKKRFYHLPWWGKVSAAGLFIFWILAWTRMDWVANFQSHTFFPLWLCLILTVNALTVRKTGTCPLTESPKRFLILFPASALFWWTFEYLNRFVGNWYYTGSLYPALTYFLLATLSFSTVLPAVESMKALLMTFDRINRGCRTMPALPRMFSKTQGYLLMTVGSISLSLIGIFPDPLFFTIWLAPFFIILGHAIVRGLPHPFVPLASGNYTVVAAYALAALCCGFFWELFNMFSLARWEYSIPYVQVCHIFEMPVLGYAGYLPFGLECALIIHIVYDHIGCHNFFNA